MFMDVHSAVLVHIEILFEDRIKRSFTLRYYQRQCISMILCLIAFNAEQSLVSHGIDLPKLLVVQVLTLPEKGEAFAVSSLNIL